MTVIGHQVNSVTIIGHQVNSQLTRQRLARKITEPSCLCTLHSLSLLKHSLSVHIPERLGFGTLGTCPAMDTRDNLACQNNQGLQSLMCCLSSRHRGCSRAPHSIVVQNYLPPLIMRFIQVVSELHLQACASLRIASVT